LIYAALTDNLGLLQQLLSPQFKGLKLSINDANNDGTWNARLCTDRHNRRPLATVTLH
jgi:hypothetical protein